MTVPKLRGWDKDNEEWVENFFLEKDGSIYVREEKCGCGSLYCHECKELSLTAYRGELIIMYFTGIKDKKDDEIFDGDIVRTTRFCKRVYEDVGLYEYRQDFTGVVKQLEGVWVIDIGCEVLPLWTETGKNLVIGNIYEHKHLLEEIIYET